MNALQWLIIAAPAIVLYPLLIFTLESDGKINKASNALLGLLLAPLLTFLIPIMAIQIIGEFVRKKEFGPAIMVIAALLLIGSILGLGLYAARDQPMDLNKVEAE